MEDWISHAILYQVNWRSIASREPRNPIEAAAGSDEAESPIAYLTRGLDTIASLGVNVLYLMPVFPSGEVARKGIGSPYSIRDFKAVSPEYGTLQELVELIRAAHRLGMRLILDLTPNHTSRDNVWIAAHPEYYVCDGRGVLGFDFDWSDTAKLNYENPGLREAMQDVLVHWLSVAGRDADGRPEGMDGFRLDMAHMINDLSFWNEAVAHVNAMYPDRDVLYLAECYGFDNNTGLFDREINAAYDDDFYKVLQYGYAVTESGKSVVALSGDSAGNADFAPLREAFLRGGIAGAMGEVLQRYETRADSSAGGPWLARYTDNHDEGRGLWRFGDGAVRAAMQLSFLAPRTLPLLLAGQEFGAINRPTIHARLGVCDKGPRIVTADGERVEPGVEFQGNLFEASAAGRQEWYLFYKRLIELRLSEPALTRGSFLLVDLREDAAATERTVIAFERELDGRCLRCAVNMGSEPRALARPDLLDGEPLYGELADGCLGPFAAIVTLGM